MGRPPWFSALRRNAGRGAPFTPASLPSLAAWYRADLGVRARTAAQFTGANSEYLSKTDTDDSLDMGDITFWFAGWVYMDSVAAGTDNFLSKGWSNGPYILFRTTAAIQWQVGDGATAPSVQATALSAATWYFVMVYHDHTNNLIGISVNGGAFTTTGHSTGTSLNATEFALGKDVAGTGYNDGRMQMWSVGKSPTDSLSTIRDLLYNSGSGKVYSDLTSAQKTSIGLVSWWSLTENSGTRADSHGSNTLTDNNTVTDNDGKVDYAAADGDKVWKWEDQSANAIHLTQTTQASKPTLQTSEINGQPILRGDGTDDRLTATADALDSIGTYSGFGVFKHDSTKTGTQIIFGKGNTGSVQEFDFEYDRTAQKNSMIQGGGTVILTATNEVTDDAAHSFYNERGGSAGAWTAAIRNDGSANGSATGIATDPSGDSDFGMFNLGSGVVSSFCFKGDIAEVGICSDVLSAGNITSVEAYLASRYGI